MKLRSMGQIPVEPFPLAPNVEPPAIRPQDLFGLEVRVSKPAPLTLPEMRFQCLCEVCRTPLFNTDQRKSYRLCFQCEEGGGR